MGRTKDACWQYVEISENGRFFCKFCRCEFAGGISRFKWHWSGLKSHDIKVCEQVPPGIRGEVRQKLGYEKDEYQLLDKQLAKWLFLYDINPNAIASAIFMDILKSISEYGPSYQLPSPDTLGEELIEDVKEDATVYDTDFRRDLVQASCTLMVDHFNGNIFAHSQTGVAFMKSFNVELSSDDMLEVISSAINFLGPNRVLQLLLSDVNDCDDISRKFENHHLRIIVSFCAAGVVESFLVGMRSELHSTIGFVQLIFCTYYHYNASYRRGMKIPEKHSAFILFMLKSVISMEDELQDISFFSMVESGEQVKLLDEQERASHFICAKLLDYVIGHKEFWSGVKLVAQVWDLLYQTRCLVNLEDSNMGYLYQMIERLKDGFEKIREQDHFIFDCSWKSFTEMREKIIHPIHAAAAFLDPAYMYTGNFEINAEMKDGIEFMFENMIDSDEREAFTKELQIYRLKLPELFTAQAVTMLKTCHPGMWWDYCGKHKVPVLSKYAIRILSQPCSTLFCRRYKQRRDDYEWKEGWRPDDYYEIEVGWRRKVNTMIMNENSRSPKLEPIILDKLGKDLGAFTDRTEERIERYLSSLSKSFTDDALVDCMKNDSSPFWENVGKNMLFLGIDLKIWE